RHARPRKIAREPFVPMTVIVLFEAAVGDQVVITQRGDRERSGQNRTARVIRANAENALFACIFNRKNNFRSSYIESGEWSAWIRRPLDLVTRRRIPGRRSPRKFCRARFRLARCNERRA